VSLRRQLLLLSLLLLSVPWAGCQFLRETDAVLRQSQTQALLATAQAASAVLSAELSELLPAQGAASQRSIYFHPLAGPVLVDGYAEEWADIPGRTLTGTGALQLSWQAGIHRDQLALYIRVRDDSVVHFSPARSTFGNGDRVQLLLGDGRRVDLGSSAPGELTATYRADGEVKSEGRIRGYWQDTADGYAIELTMPRSLTAQRLALVAIDERPAETGDSPQRLASAPRPVRIVYPSSALEARLELFLRPGLNLRVVDREHWLLADQGGLGAAADQPDNWLLRRLYQVVLDDSWLTPRPQPQGGRLDSAILDTALAGGTAHAWYRLDQRSQGGVLHLAVPLYLDNDVVGALLAEQSRAQSLALADSAFGRLLLVSFAAIAITVAGLLGYAAWLSWRVRRLQRAVSEALREDGSIRDDFPHSTLNDELGELSRSAAHLLARLREYTDYLKSLSRKLSHELRTPIAIVRSSLDNLQNHPDDATYRQRASEGIDRLGRLVTAMSEATRVEESIRQARPETCDLAVLLEAMVEGYRQVYPQHLAWQDRSEGRAMVQAVPELLAQMLDKLFDNASDFCPVNGEIRVQLHVADQRAIIRVENDGPALPGTLADRLFDNLVSVRDSSSGGHLGLGLYIVKLIVDYHRGAIHAENIPGGVRFELAFDTLPQIAER
jgi:dedicated sortase system histidine kinase